jgi:hypothetical protein
MTQIINVLQPDGSIQEMSCEVQIASMATEDGSTIQCIELLIPQPPTE